METITLSLRRPLQDREWLKKIGIGALIGFIPILNLSLLGYLLEWIMITSREPENAEFSALPEWKGFGRLLANGLIVFVIILGYSLVPVILLGIGRTMVISGWIYSVLGYLFKFLAGLGSVLMSFILPIVLINFAHDGKIEAAYDIKSIVNKIAVVFPEYLLVYLFSVGLVILVWIIVAILSHIILGYILVTALNFYIGLVIFYRFSTLLSRTGG